MVSAITIAVIVAIASVALVCCNCGDKFASPRTDFLSARFPTSGMYPTASGELPVPFHIYAADFYAVWADVDLAAVTKILSETNDLVPVRTQSGRAIAGFWSYHYTDTTAGPYNEVVLLVAAAHKSVVGEAGLVLPDEPMSWIQALLFNGNYTSYTVKLWLSEQVPVDWGRDICGIPKVLAKVGVTVDEGASGEASTIINADYQTQPVMSVRVPAVDMVSSLKAQMSMLGQFSFKQIWSALNEQTVSFPVIFPKGVIDKAQDQTINPETLMIIRNDPPPVLQYWQDSFHFDLQGEFAHFKAQPRLVQRQSPARAVLFAPHNMRPARSA